MMRSSAHRPGSLVRTRMYAMNEKNSGLRSADETANINVVLIEIKKILSVKT